MDVHRKFRDWAIAQGVTIDALAAHRFSGRGLGIRAERDLEAGEQIINVPISALRTIHTIPKLITKAIGPCTVHGLLAADLCLNSDPNLQPWFAVLPTSQDLKSSMPLTWAAELQALLPPAASKILFTQKSKLAEDWAVVSKAYTSLEYSTYLHAWLVINTRTFYFESPPVRKFKPVSRNDCMAMVPFADYFNHSSSPTAHVVFSPLSYTITASERTKKGEEIYISYGMHSNDYLLAEYGFVLEENGCDEISLDDQILPLLSEKQKMELEFEGFLGHYVLDRETVCQRTQVALRLLCTSAKKWKRFVDGTADGRDSQDEVDAILAGVIKRQKEEAQKSIERISKLRKGLDSQRETLSRRWKQIFLLLDTAIARIQT